MACVLPETEWNNYSEQIKKNPLTDQGNDWPWVSLANKYAARDENKEFEAIPPRGKGLIRVGWHGRNRPAGYNLQLSVRIWNQPERLEGGRYFETLDRGHSHFCPNSLHAAAQQSGRLGSAE